MKPTTQYAKSGRINIAYQVFGSGTMDLVYIPGWVSNIDWMWACPELVDFLTELGRICRVVLFDKRGTGLSDRIVELSTLEERMDDIRAVMDAIGSEKAILFGHSEGGCVSALFAATYPNRVIAMLTFGIFAKRRYSPAYPWAPTDEERQVVYDMIENSWGSGKMKLESLAPSKAHDKTFMDWLANYFRSGASPSAAMVLTKMNTQVDIIDILGSIRVPTLIMQRTHDIDVKIEEGRFIAERIQGAKFLELEGNDHLFWVGNTEVVLREMKAFILSTKSESKYEERLFTVVGARIIPEDKVSSDSKGVIGQLVAKYRGKIVTFDNGLIVAAFEGPSRAAHCSIDLMNAAKSFDSQMAFAIHIKEASLAENFLSAEEDTELVMQVLRQAKSSEIVITQTVRNLLSGAGLSIVQRNSISDRSTGQSHLLFTIDDLSVTEVDTDVLRNYQIPKNDSFLENVLQEIEVNLSNDAFGLDMLCREVGMSERQLQRKLKAITNKSPVQLISSVRLHRAKELLLSKKYNIAEVAFKVGFSNPSYFSKGFKKEFGQSPSKLLQGNP